MRVLVTGAGGFVGRHVLHELKVHGHEPVAGMIHLEKLDGPLAQIKTVILDINNRDQAIETLDKGNFDSIIHLAAISHVGDAEKATSNLIDVNVTGTGNLLDALSHTKKRARMLFVSSSQVFATPLVSSALDESSLAHPETPYGWSKLAAENLCQIYRTTGHDVIIARPFNHIGPGQLPNFVVSGMASRIKAIPNGDALKVGNLETYRDFTDVRDIARAYRLILEAKAPSPIYVLGSGKCIKIRDIVNSLLEISGKKVTLEIDPSLLRKVDPARFMANPTLALHELNWKPELSIKSTLEEIYRIA